MQNHYERLGLPRRFSVDARQLEAAYLAASRLTHPDFQVAGGVDTHMNAAALNQAYTTLKDPARRAEYWLNLHDGPTAQQEKQLDPAFLAAMMDLQEAIDEAEDEPQRDELQTRIEAMKTAELIAVASIFADDAPTSEALLAGRRHMNAVSRKRERRVFFQFRKHRR